jgi:hypothetical protein
MKVDSKKVQVMREHEAGALERTRQLARAPKAKIRPFGEPRTGKEVVNLDAGDGADWLHQGRNKRK